MKWKIGMVQMHVVAGEQERNLAHGESLIREAAGNGVDLVVLPECCDLGWTDPSSTTEAEPIPSGSPFQRIAAAAAANDIFVCAGLTERSGTNVYNSAVLVDPTGALLLHHRKINGLDIEQPFYSVGDRLGVVDTDLGRIGIMICADAFAPGQVISRTLGHMGAQIILSPSAWAVSDRNLYSTRNPYGEIWRENYQPVTEEFQLWIAGVSNVGAIPRGPWRGRYAIGASLLYGPGGKEILQGPYGDEAETILVSTISYESVMDR